MLNKVLFILISWLVGLNYAVALPIKIVAAENFYGQLAAEIGGNAISVQSIITSPTADPHLFTTSPNTNKALYTAQIIIYNGAGYDNWMDNLLKIANNKAMIINVADLMKVADKANPHIWYKPETMPTLAKLLAKDIISLDNSQAKQVNANLQRFLKDNEQINAEIAAIKRKNQNIPVTATEPVYGYMADAMGLNMLGLDFQWKMMNDTEPSPKMLADYEQLLLKHKVKLLFYNQQVSDEVSKNILNLAHKNNIPVVGISETMPLGLTINEWLRNGIEQTAAILKDLH